MEARTKHEPIDADDFGIPYFRADVRNSREVGICPRCGEVVIRTKGSFGRHWDAAVKYEAVAR